MGYICETDTFGWNRKITEVTEGDYLLFKNAGLDKTVSEIDLNHLVLETDSPYLSPVPKRGKRNESSHLIYTAEKIAEIKNISLNELSEITNNNAVEIFGDKII